MSYNDPADNLWFDTTTNEWHKVNSQTPMIYDVQAMQYIYGANMTYKTGNDVYTFDDLAPFRMTIWDASGTDTISVANSSRASLINLNEGSFSSIQTNRVYSENAITDVIDGTYNLGIAYGAIIENATGGGSGDDKLIGNQYANTLNGNAGADTMIGNAGDDLIFGDNGNDVVYGGADGDNIWGGFGADTLDGGDGYWDSIRYDGDTVGVTVNLLTNTTSGGEAQGDIISNFEHVYGGRANDTIIGNAQNNYLFGNAGDDLIFGDNGNDVVYGGAGADTFVFNTTLNATTNNDKLMDFTHNDDSISLDDVIFTQLATTGALSSDMFALGAANDANDYILYNSSTGNISYDSDGNGAGVAVTFATLSNKPIDLSYNDFMVI